MNILENHGKDKKVTLLCTCCDPCPFRSLQLNKWYCNGNKQHISRDFVCLRDSQKVIALENEKEKQKEKERKRMKEKKRTKTIQSQTTGQTL